MSLWIRVAVIVALALGGVPAAPAQDVGSIESEASALSLSHDPVTCMVANAFPQVDASLTPQPSVQSARVYFRSALGPDFYYVEMQPEAGRFVGTLPRPNADAGPITYYVEGLGTDYTQTQTGESSAVVVEEESDCEGRVAPVAPFGTPVQVYSLTGSTVAPPGFSGVSSVLAGAGSGAAAVTGAGTGSFITSTGGLVLMGAAVVGIATAIILNGDEDPPPASGSR